MGMARGGFCRLIGSALIVTLASPSAFALDPGRRLTQYVHRIWQVQQGLPQATIYCVRQTHDGYIWLGTQTGPARFDGVRFTSAITNDRDEIQNLWVNDIAEDSGHALWVATEGDGLIRLKDGRAAPIGTDAGLPSKNIRCLLVDRGGDLWAGTDAGVARLHQHQWIIYHKKDGLPTESIRGICQSPDGTIWLGGDSTELAAFDGVAFALHPIASLPADSSVRAVVCPAAGTVWIGTTVGLVRLSGGRERRYTAADGLADDWVTSLATGSDTSLWVGTVNGFSRLHGDEIERFGTRDGLSQSTVYSVFEDREGSLWVATKHGLNQFTNRRTIPFTTSEGLASNDTGPILEDRAGRIWVGTLDAGLSGFDGRRFFAAGKSPWAGAGIRALADDGDDGVWVGTDRGLSHLRGGEIDRSFAISNGLPSDRVQCLLRDSHGTLWVGTAAGPAVLRDGKLFSLVGCPPKPVLAVGEHGGRVLLSVQGTGLYCADNGQIQRLNVSPMPPRDVDCFYEDPDGTLWMGTRGSGMCLLDGGAIRTFSSKQGLYDDDIYGIVADDYGRLWLACSKGTFSLNRADLHKLATGAITTLVSTSISPIDALRTVECQPDVQPVVCRMRDGRAWFSTIHGVLVVDPAHNERNYPPAPVVLDEVIVNGSAHSPAQIGKLPPGQTNIEFRYTALSFRSPTRITFRYRLEGFDKGWIDAGTRREAFYTNLPPGPFVFHVAARNVDGPWNEFPSPLAFEIAPHFYQTAWFAPTCVALAIAGGWWVFRRRVHRVTERMRLILSERSRIARELHDTLIQGFSGVTMQMQALAQRLERAKERSTLEEIIRDAGTCLREARQSVAGLRGPAAPQSGLPAAIAAAARQLIESSSFRLKLDLPATAAGFDAEVQYNLLRIVHEAVANAVKHSGGRTIRVTLRSAADQMQLSISDDGRGFDVEAAPRSGHYGLIGMKERAAQIGADLKLESRPARGTMVRLIMPIGKSRRASAQEPAVAGSAQSA